MKRRSLLAALAVPALVGCGFQLRQAPAFAFRRIFVNVAPTSPIGRDLKRALASGGTVTVVEDPAAADVVLDVLAEQREKVVVGLSAVGQVREFELRVRFRFRLRTPQGKDLIAESEIAQQRDISFTESSALAKEAEEHLLYRAMQAEVVQQTMRRLAALNTV
ncbi:MAG TPA: LPS assembly lipoprotein LptE [Ramlibacter sp.]|nr:LPS assembly lipoprotein LptE [Ramlibacter sp.]